MKVIVYSVMPVIPPDYGGAIRVFNVAKELSEKGINVILVSPKPEKHVRELDRRIKQIFFKPPMSKLYKKIKILNRMKYITYFFSFKELVILYKIVKAEVRNRNLVLQSEYLYSVAPLYVLKKLFNIPLIITEHNVESKLSFEINNNKHYYNILKYIERFFLSRCDYIVCVSETDRNVLQNEYAISEKKIVVSPNATNIPRINQNIQEEISEIKGRFGIEDNTYLVLFVGTLNYAPNKKAVKIIKEKICPVVKANTPNVKFLIIGKGVKPKVEGDIIFTGVVGEIDPYIQMSDVAIAPLVQGGGTRLKILEYMAFSKPVVSTSKGAEGLEIIDNENILISDDWGIFSEKIIELLNNLEKREKLGKNARMLVEKKYTWTITCEKYVEVYKKVI